MLTAMIAEPYRDVGERVQAGDRDNDLSAEWRGLR
jgi:hypothetical protein